MVDSYRPCSWRVFDSESMGPVYVIGAEPVERLEAGQRMVRRSLAGRFAPGFEASEIPMEVFALRPGQQRSALALCEGIPGLSHQEQASHEIAGASANHPQRHCRRGT